MGVDSGPIIKSLSFFFLIEDKKKEKQADNSHHCHFKSKIHSNPCVIMRSICLSQVVVRTIERWSILSVKSSPQIWRPVGLILEGMTAAWQTAPAGYPQRCLAIISEKEVTHKGKVYISNVLVPPPKKKHANTFIIFRNKDS